MVRPPDTVWAFYLHFVRPVKWLVLAVLVLSLVGSLIEMGLFVFLGWLVDWTTQTPAAEFFAVHGWQLAAMGADRPGRAAGGRAPVAHLQQSGSGARADRPACAG